MPRTTTPPNGSSPATHRPSSSSATGCSCCPGVRYESTNVDYSGFDVLYDDGGDYVSTKAGPGGRHHGSILPGLHVKYAMTDATNVRAAFTRTLARPNYYDLVPYQLVFQEDGEITRGNSNLTPTTSDNVDVLRRALPPLGRRGLGRRVLQEAERLHLSVPCVRDRLRRHLPGDAASQRRQRLALGPRTGVPEPVPRSAEPARRPRRDGELHVDRFVGHVSPAVPTTRRCPVSPRTSATSRSGTRSGASRPGCRGTSTASTSTPSARSTPTMSTTTITRSWTSTSASASRRTCGCTRTS